MAAESTWPLHLHTPSEPNTRINYRIVRMCSGTRGVVSWISVANVPTNTVGVIPFGRR